MCEECKKYWELYEHAYRSSDRLFKKNEELMYENIRLIKQMELISCINDYDANYTTAKRVLSKNWKVAELSVSYDQNERTGVIITETNDLYEVFYEMWDKSLINVQEQLNVLYLNQIGEVIGFRNVSTGKINSASVDINLIIGIALNCRAVTIAIAHNHPGGILKPSGVDINVTQRIKQACELLDVSLMDHLILSRESYYSFYGNGILK